MVAYSILTSRIILNIRQAALRTTTATGFELHSEYVQPRILCTAGIPLEDNGVSEFTTPHSNDGVEEVRKEEA